MAETLASQHEAARRKRELGRKCAMLEQHVASLRSDYATEAAELRRQDNQVGAQTRVLSAERAELARLPQADVTQGAARAPGKRKAKSQG